MKRIVLCADDYGQSQSISTGIYTLAAAGRLSAVSCMSAAHHWPEAARTLRESHADVDVGLHFTLIGERFLDSAALAGATTTTALGGLIRTAYLRRLDRGAIIQALNTQLDRFHEHLGREPDFIDGHQHIHQLPIVRTALLEVYKQRFTRHRPYIRNLAHITASSHAGVKPKIIKALGARPLQRALHQQQIPHNHDFGGIYDFSETDRYRMLMRYWLNHAQDGALFMCHPGLENRSDSNDPIARARQHEYHYLNSEKFQSDCHDANVQLVRGNVAGWN